MERTDYNGELRLKDEGREVSLVDGCPQEEILVQFYS